MSGSGAPDRAFAVRAASVAGSFYPANPATLRALVGELLRDAPGRTTPGAAPPGRAASGTPGRPAGILVPHAGLVYSGVVAAAGWQALAEGAPEPLPTVVILGTNHVSAWLEGIAAWETGSWRTPLGESFVDASLAAEILAAGPPFLADRAAHLGEHSIEIQLPLLQTVMPRARIVPLSVAAGTGPAAVEAGRALGRILAARAAQGEAVALAISTDMAHYPPHDACTRTTETLLPAILDLDPVALVALERAVRHGGTPGMACGMCGINPAVVGLAALGAMGVGHGTRLAAATSADAGGPPDRTVGYLAVAFHGS